LPRPALRGDCQLRNAAAAIAAVDALAARLPVPGEAIARGLTGVRLPGRFEVIAASEGRPEIILDVAHNPEAASVLARNLRERRGTGRTIAVAGMLADKDIAGVLAALSGIVDRWFFASLDVARGAPASTLAAAIKDPGAAVECSASVAQALAGAAKAAGENDRIVALGSFHTVAAVLRAIGGAA
jgi:dihydrofolate synthase/folylpolyglutamate synthase